MAQPSTPQRASDAIAGGLGQSTTAARAWSSSILGRVRQSVLPDDDGLVYGIGDEPGLARFARANGRRALAVVSRLVVGVAVALLLVAIGLFAFRTFYADRIYPAVVVGDVNVGGLTAA
ncbi:MAG: hypothetical protein M3457_01805, partial [Chloroflexota bacterium]|nr:hypothetical protein [Chloroflexota bacterium]